MDLHNILLQMGSQDGNWLPGSGAHPNEEHLWQDPVYKVHPLTGYKEAVTMGLFFRLWPEHVKILQRMHKDGWAHYEIARVAAELWKRQQETYKQEQEVILQLKEGRDSAFQEKVNKVFAPAADTVSGVGGVGVPTNALNQIGAIGQAMEANQGAEKSIANVENSLRSHGLIFKVRRGLEDIENDEREYRKTLDAYRKFFQKVPRMSFAAILQKGKDEKSYFSVPRLSYTYDALEPIISQDVLKAHHQVLHQKYVDGLNNVVQSLPDDYKSLGVASLLVVADCLDAELRDMLLFFAGGHLNHTLLWRSLQPLNRDKFIGYDLQQLNSETLYNFDIDGFPVELKRALELKFGSIELLWDLIIKKAQDELLGPGWVYLVAAPELEVRSYALHGNPIMEGCIPLLGFDCWEHAYNKDYGADISAYLKALLPIINWKEVWRRWKLVQRMSLGMRKGDLTGGERTLTPEEEQVRYDQTFTRKDPGVLNAPPIPDPKLVDIRVSMQDNKDEEDDDEDDKKE